MVDSPPVFSFTDPPVPVSLEPAAAPVQSSAPHDVSTMGIPDAVQMPRLPKQKAARQPVEGAYRGLRSRGPAELREGLIAINEVENKSVD